MQAEFPAVPDGIALRLSGGAHQSHDWIGANWLPYVPDCAGRGAAQGDAPRRDADPAAGIPAGQELAQTPRC